MLLTTFTLDPNRSKILEDFEKDLLTLLPADYIDFIKNFGSGGYCDNIIISSPNEENIPVNFGAFTDFWDFNELYTAEDLLNSIQIGATIDGDIICVAKEKGGKVFILPRHSETIDSFPSFFAAAESLKPKEEIEYFDPDFDSQYEQIVLIKSSALVDIQPIHKTFLESYKYDFVVRESTQPKYIIKALGGWISFDLIYKNSINVKFQKQHTEIAQPIIKFLKQYLA